MDAMLAIVLGIWALLFLGSLYLPRDRRLV
jgi:hypothetical protein